MEVIFLTYEDIVLIHDTCVNATGGGLGVRDRGLLESALAQPHASFGDQYLHEDVYAMAAAYMYHIIKNHPFIDGNKRTGTVVGCTFLEVNDYVFSVSQSVIEQLACDVSTDKVNKEQLAEFFRQHII